MFPEDVGKIVPEGGNRNQARRRGLPRVWRVKGQVVHEGELVGTAIRIEWPREVEFVSRFSINKLIDGVGVDRPGFAEYPGFVPDYDLLGEGITRKPDRSRETCDWTCAVKVVALRQIVKVESYKQLVLAREKVVDSRGVGIF